MPTLIARLALEDYADFPLETLVQLLGGISGVRVEITDHFESGLPKRLTLVMTVNDGYGEHTRATWDALWTQVQRAWSYDGGKHLRRDTTYHLIDEDGRPWGQIRRAREAGEPRDYLGDERLSCGTGLELLMADGHWTRCRYEVAREDGEVHAMAYLYAFGTTLIVHINEAMVFRTIESGSRR